MGRVAGADVVEDALTEDVPSSIVGYQKLRGAYTWSMAKTVLGRQPSAGDCSWNPSFVPLLRRFAWEKSQKNRQKMENKCAYLGGLFCR